MGPGKGSSILSYPFLLGFSANTVVVYSLSHVWVFCDPMGSSPPGSSVHGISKTRIPEWAAISFSNRSSRPGDQTCGSCIAGGFFTIWAIREALYCWAKSKIDLIIADPMFVLITIDMVNELELINIFDLTFTFLEKHLKGSIDAILH